jgi:hypothetical protein
VLASRGLSFDAFPAENVRGLAALVAKGLVSWKELDDHVTAPSLRA